MRTTTLTADDLAEVRLRERRRFAREIVDMLLAWNIDIGLVDAVAASGGIEIGAGPVLVTGFDGSDEHVVAVANLIAERVETLRERDVRAVVEKIDAEIMDHGLPRDGPSVEGADEWADLLNRTGVVPS